MELYELFDEAVSELEPMPDQVAAAQRVWRRRQRATLSAVFATGAAFAIGAGTLIASAPWAGHSGLEPDAGTLMTRTDYSHLVDSTLSRLWPVQGRPPGHVNVELTNVSPYGEIQVQFEFSDGTIVPYLNLGIAQETDAAVRRAQTCPNLGAGPFFCTTTKLADGAVVQVTNVNSPLTPVAGIPNDYLVQVAPSALSPYPGPSTAKTGSLKFTPPAVAILCQVVSVWEGDYVETLFVPNVPAPKLTVAQLLALGSSTDFQMLLTTAVDNNLVPGVQMSIPTAWPSLVPTDTPTFPAGLTPPALPTGTGSDTVTPAWPTATATVPATPAAPPTNAPTNEPTTAPATP